MAKKGNFTALQQLRPLQGDISDDIKYWNEDADAKRGQKTYEDELAYQKELDRKAEKQKLFDDYVKPIDNYDTGSSSWNEANARLIQSAMEKYPELIAVLDDPNASQEAKIKAKLGFAKLQALPEKLKLISDVKTSEFQTYLDAKEKGVAWENPQAEIAYKNAAKGIQFGLDENLEPIIAFVDKDGDGKNDILGVQKYYDIQNMIPAFDFEKKHNVEGVASELAANLTKGIKDITTREGYTTERVKAVADEDKANLIQNTLYKEDGSISSITRSALIEAGVKPSEATKQDIEDVKTRLTDLINAELPEIREEEFDFSALNNARKENRLQRSTDAKVAGFTEAVDPSEQTWGDKVTDISGKSVGLNNVKVGAIKGKDGSVTSNADVKNYSYKKDGTMLVDVEYPKTKSVSKKEYEDAVKGANKGVETDREFLARVLTSESGERRITIPGTNDKKVIEVSREDEAGVAKAMGSTVEDLREKAGFGEQPKQTYKGIDENGDPIFE